MWGPPAATWHSERACTSPSPGPGCGRPASSSARRLPRVSESFSLWHLPLPSSKLQLCALRVLSAAACKSFPPVPPWVASLPQASPHLHLLKTRLPVCTAVGEGRGEIRAPRRPRTQPATCSPQPPGLEAVCLPVTLAASPLVRSAWTWQPGNDFATSPILSCHAPKHKREAKWLFVSHFRIPRLSPPRIPPSLSCH